MTDQKGKGVPDTELVEDRRQGRIDRFLKRAMPNGTVMRRYIAGAFIIGSVFGGVGIQLIDRTDSNTARSAKAICAIIIYGETTLDQSPSVNANSEAIARFRKLVHDMRATGVRCSPPPPHVSER